MNASKRITSPKIQINYILVSHIEGIYVEYLVIKNLIRVLVQRNYEL